jgi:hypothetical protein
LKGYVKAILKGKAGRKSCVKGRADFKGYLKAIERLFTGRSRLPRIFKGGGTDLVALGTSS